MSEVTIQHIEPTTVAFLALQGSYTQVAEGFGTLYQWVEAEEFAPYGPPMMVFLSDPVTTQEQDNVWELWAPISGPQHNREANEAGLGVRRVPGGPVATATHIGRYDELERTYTEILSWITANKKEIIGPPMEVYLSDPATVPEAEYVTQVRIPVE